MTSFSESEATTYNLDLASILECEVDSIVHKDTPALSPSLLESSSLLDFQDWLSPFLGTSLAPDSLETKNSQSPEDSTSSIYDSQVAIAAESNLSCNGCCCCQSKGGRQLKPALAETQRDILTLFQECNKMTQLAVALCEKEFKRASLLKVRPQHR